MIAWGLRPFTFLAAATLAVTASAQATSDPPRGPPAEALAACTGLAEGTACSFALDGREWAGKCRSGPNGEAAACLPDHPPGPPPEALQACSGLSEGAACTVSHGGTSLSGTCRSGPPGSALACAPDQMPPGRP